MKKLILIPALFLITACTDGAIQEISRTEIQDMPAIVEYNACSDYCPGPAEDYVVKIYEGVNERNECESLGGTHQTIIGWGAFNICVAPDNAEELAQEQAPTVTNNTDCKLQLNTSPLALENLDTIIPLGQMTGSHVTPTDHQYWGTPDQASYQIPRANPGLYDVYSPAAGIVKNIEQFQPGDYRIVIEHACNLQSIYIHVAALSDKLENATDFTNTTEHSYQSVNISVEEGDVVATIDKQSFDYSLHDYNIVLPGYIDPSRYDSESWKVHTVDPFDYFEPTLAEALKAKSLRTVEPIGGKIDYDIKGKLVGNWFKEGHEGYNGEGFYKNHLSVVYDHIDPTQIRISIGNFGGESGQFGVIGNTPDPANIDSTSGIITYKLAQPDWVTDNGQYWDRQGHPQSQLYGIVNDNQDPLGIALFELIEEGQLKAEFFPNQSSASAFTSAAQIYVR